MEGRNIAWNVRLRYQLECWVADSGVAAAAVAAMCVELFLQGEENQVHERVARGRDSARVRLSTRGVQ